jgi:hypothetical protein
MQYLNYALWAIGAFFLSVGAGTGQSETFVLGIVFIVAGSLRKIMSAISNYTSSKAQDDLLKLKSLLDQGILTQEEYNKTAQKLKEKL